MLTTSVDFGVASHGVNWAASKLPADFEACLAKYPKAAGQDDYVVRFAGKGKATVLANSAVGAIAGLLDDNLRVRSCAIGHLRWVLKLPGEAIVWNADDAEKQARKAADEILATLGNDPAWRDVTPPPGK